MSGAAAGGILPGKGATVDIFGRKVSWDALLVAGAGLAGVIFLYKVGQPVSSSPMSTVGSSGGGGDTGTTGTVPSGPPPQPPQSFANPYGGGTGPDPGGGGGGTGPDPGGGGGGTGPGSQVSSQVTVPVQNASYQVPVASGSYMPSGSGGLTAGPIGGGAGTVSTSPSAPSSGGLSVGYTQGSYVAPTPSSPPPPTTTAAPAPAGGGSGSFTP